MPYKKRSLSPGSIIYTGDYTDEPLLIEVCQYDTDKADWQTFENGNLKTVKKIIENTTEDTWINFVGLNHLDDVMVVCEALGLSRLLIEDLLHVTQRSKLEISEDLLFMTVKMLMLTKEARDYQDKALTDNEDLKGFQVSQEHITIVKKGTVLMTFQENKADVFGDVRKRLDIASSQVRQFGVDYLAYALIDAIVEEQMEILHGMNELMDKCEEELLEGHKLRLEWLYHIRKVLMSIKASALPLKDIVLCLVAKEMQLILPQTKLYFKDIDDHLSHVMGQVLHYRDMVNNLYEMHAMETSNHMNRVMTTLTIFSAVFIPLNFMAGFFGMNFKHFSWLTYQQGIPVFISFCVALAITLLVVFKRLNWLN